MVEIKPHGRFYELDEQGCLINESSLDNAQAPWRKLVDDANDRVMSHFGDRLQSLYLSGSIPRGLAVQDVSDLDLIMLLYDDMDSGPHDQEWERTVRSDLVSQYAFLTDAEFSVSTTMDYLSFDMGKVTIKARSCLLYGDDLAQFLPEIKVDRNLAKALDFQLQRCLDQVKRYLKDRPASELDASDTRWIMKRIVCSGMTLVLERAGRFSPDLYPQYETFSEFYPEHKASMRRAMEIAINADTNSPEDDQLLNEFGPWLVTELERHDLA